MREVLDRKTFNAIRVFYPQILTYNSYWIISELSIEFLKKCIKLSLHVNILRLFRVPVWEHIIFHYLIAMFLLLPRQTTTHGAESVLGSGTEYGHGLAGADARIATALCTRDARCPIEEQELAG